MTSLTVDLLVLGWGKAGKTLAARFAEEAGSVVLVERPPSMYGGACINIACVPTKDLRDGIWTHPSGMEAFNEVLSELRRFNQ